MAAAAHLCVGGVALHDFGHRGPALVGCAPPTGQGGAAERAARLYSRVRLPPEAIFLTHSRTASLPMFIWGGPFAFFAGGGIVLLVLVPLLADSCVHSKLPSGEADTNLHCLTTQ